MPATAFANLTNTLPNSSDLNRDIWLNSNPKQLISEGYAEPVTLAPQQAQSPIDSETKSAGTNDPSDPTFTAPVSHDGSIKRLRTPRPTHETPHWVTMHALQEWEGYVLEKGEEEFIARLSDLSSDTLASEMEPIADEEAIISLSEISDDDIARLHTGSVFRWVIGYERSASGTKRRISQIVLRDLPAMTEQDKSEGLDWAKKVAQLLRD